VCDLLNISSTTLADLSDWFKNQAGAFVPAFYVMDEGIAYGKTSNFLCQLFY
jgi:hypothetical protein